MPIHIVMQSKHLKMIYKGNKPPDILCIQMIKMVFPMCIPKTVIKHNKQMIKTNVSATNFKVGEMI